MWQGARGNQVSPDLWDDDIEVVPMKLPSESFMHTPPQYVEKVEKIAKSKPKVVEHEKMATEHSPSQIDDFVYQPRPKEAIRSNSDKKNGFHEWTPFLWERKRDMLMAGPSKPSKGFKYRLKNKWNSLKISWREFMYSMEVWRGAIKKVEGHQGMGVVSYFVFLRWLFFLNIFIFLLIFWVITFFQIVFDPEAGYDEDLLGSGEYDFSSYVNNVATCTAQYSPNVSSDALTLVLDFFQGTGWMENTAMFYGFYVDRKVQLAASSYNLPLAYFLVAVTILIVSLIVMVRSTLSNFKDTVLSEENSKQANYCNNVFAGMDYNIGEEEAMCLKQKSIYNGLIGELAEQRHNLEAENRTSSEKCKLYTIRFFVNLVIIIMLAGAGAAIYYAQDFSSEFTTDPNVENDYHSLVILLVEFLPSIVIGLLNGIYPLIFDFLVQFEGYKPAFVIKISLARMVFLKLASLCMIVASLYVQITCTDHDACLVGRNGCPAIECWETYVGSAVYKLVIMDFLINFGITIFVELPRKLITTKCECGLFQKIGPAIFDIPKNVLDLVYGQTLVWLGFYFAPLISAVSIFTFFCLFYLKLLSAMYNTVPPEKPYHASKSNSFFTVILMVAFFMICVPVGYTLSNLDPSPMCGPFRIYQQPSDIIDVQVNNADEWFQTIWDICTSSAVVSALIILLCLAIYYCSELNSAHKNLVDVMKEQLVMEGRDKQFLLARIAELTGAPVKKKPPPYQRTQMKTVNETNANNAQKKGDIGLEIQAIDLYGTERSFVSYTLNAQAPPAADYNETTDNTDTLKDAPMIDINNTGSRSNSANITATVRRTPQESLDNW
ncbi:ion transport [Mactra antiquata]